MVTKDTETDDAVREEWQTSSSFFGLDKHPTDVYEDEMRPQPEELIDALVETDLLTETEATAFVERKLELTPDSCADGNAENRRDVARRGTEKVANAIWIAELIDAYRFAPLPEPEECGPASTEPSDRPPESSPDSHKSDDAGEPDEPRSAQELKPLVESAIRFDEDAYDVYAANETVVVVVEDPVDVMFMGGDIRNAVDGEIWTDSSRRLGILLVREMTETEAKRRETNPIPQGRQRVRDKLSDHSELMSQCLDILDTVADQNLDVVGILVSDDPNFGHLDIKSFETRAAAERVADTIATHTTSIDKSDLTITSWHDPRTWVEDTSYSVAFSP